MQWARLDSQIAAIREAVDSGVRAADEDVERAGRALERLAALERLLASTPSPASSRAPADDAAAPEPAAPVAPGRASLHRSPLADLFAATEPVPGRD
jgi:hypothetical protein